VAVTGVHAPNGEQVPFRTEAPLLLEVFHSVFDGVSPADLLAAEDAAPPSRQTFKAAGAAARLVPQRVCLSKQFLARERSMKARAAPRHARFGGTFVHQEFGTPLVLTGAPRITAAAPLAKSLDGRKPRPKVLAHVDP
jgi:hypothetical protein